MSASDTVSSMSSSSISPATVTVCAVSQLLTANVRVSGVADTLSRSFTVVSGSSSTSTVTGPDGSVPSTTV